MSPVQEQEHAPGALVEHALQRNLVFLGQVWLVLDLDPAVLERVHGPADGWGFEVGTVGGRAGSRLVGAEVVAGRRRAGSVFPALLAGRVLGALVGEVQSQLATRRRGRLLQIRLLDGRWRAALAAVGLESLGDADARVDVCVLGRIDVRVAAPAAGGDHGDDSHQHGGAEDARDHVTGDQPAALRGRLAALGVKPLLASALPVLAAAGHRQSAVENTTTGCRT